MAEATLVSRLYNEFRGVDFRGEEINLSRSPDSLNVWKDYKETDSIRTRPGFEKLYDFSDPVFGVFFYKAGDTDMTLVHSGKKLYKVVDDEKTVLFSNLAERKSQSFVFNNKWYLKDGVHYLVYDGATVSDAVGYVPTTSIARKPAGGGTMHEDVNMLCPRRINTFLSDGESTEYVLDVQSIDNTFVPIIKVNDETVDPNTYIINYAKGRVTFNTAPEEPDTAGKDNVSIEFQKYVAGHSDRIMNCTLLQVFDNRVFFSGNKDFPNTVWHSSLNDPTYCSDLDYYNEGYDKAAVKSMIAGNNALWVFREPNQENTTVFYHTPTIDADYGKIYPSSHSSISTGCIGKAVNFGDDIIFFSDRGMEGISGDITTEQVIAHRSSMVDRKLVSEKDYKDMILEEWEGYLVVFVGDKAYLADSRAMFANGSHNEYEWFYWHLNQKVNCARVNNGILYIGTDDGIYTLTDNEAQMESYWVTPKDKFKYPNKLKTTNKRGCVVEATGDISVYAKQEDTDFTLVGEYSNVKDYFVCRMKQKKFKDLQLKFHSNTRFSLETATLEAFVGSYIKR